MLAELLANGFVVGVSKETDAMQSMREYLRWTPDRGWITWTGKVWSATPEPLAIEMTRRELKRMYVLFVSMAGDDLSEAHLNKYKQLLGYVLAKHVAYFLKGLLTASPEIFDANPELLNFQNGVVDLRTGKLLEHDPDLFMTRIALVNYSPRATHSDWDKTLTAVPEDVREWLQVRYGQAATGYATDDDVLPIQTGGGSNAKSTMVGAIAAALGDYATYVPEKVLLANPGEHPTELMTLRGARLAIIEETPEGKFLPTKRLKDLLGTSTMTARAMRQDFVSWTASHTLFLNTNYVPQVAETDHAVWRRLALVKFPYKFIHPDEPIMAPNERHGDPGLRERLKNNTDDQLEAVAAWLVEGARAWFDMEGQLPTPLSVQVDTLNWRAEADLVLAYAQERLTFDSQSSVVSKDLYEDFTEWLKAAGRQVWNDQTFASRFGGHELAEKNHVTKTRVNQPANVSLPNPYAVPPTGKTTMWLGVRFN